MTREAVTLLERRRAVIMRQLQQHTALMQVGINSPTGRIPRATAQAPRKINPEHWPFENADYASIEVRIAASIANRDAAEKLKADLDLDGPRRRLKNLGALKLVFKKVIQDELTYLSEEKKWRELSEEEELLSHGLIRMLRLQDKILNAIYKED